jgi:3-deoxy-D-manno-octulosonate 8-phosphate phosphatase (KDO 8-P phosphatase)
MDASVSPHERARAVRLAAFDVDGVLTDGLLYYTDAGAELKAFHARDGHGLKLLQEGGVAVAIITSRNSPVVAHRMRNLGIEHVQQGVADKRGAMEALLAKLGLGWQAASYMGDDVIDLPVLIRCGLAAAVPGAPAIVRQHAHYVSTAAGGRGAVREFAEYVLQAQGRLDTLMAQYLA